MRALVSAALVIGIVGIPALVVWRIVRGVEGWFWHNPAAGDAILWTLVAAVVIALLGVGMGIALGAIGLGLRPYVVRLRLDEPTPRSLVEVLRPVAERPVHDAEAHTPDGRGAHKANRLMRHQREEATRG
jgi:hypothetical protein